MRTKEKNLPAFFSYVVKFLAAFCLLYFGTDAIIALSAPGGYYSSFVQHYLNYPALLRASLLSGAKTFLSFFGYSAQVTDLYHLKLENGSGIQLVYSCLGYGLMSFWAAFVFANKGTAKNKILWILAGLLILWIINVIRIALLLLAFNKHWPIPFGLDHHTFYNLVAYLAIFVMIFFFDRSQKLGVESRELKMEN